MSFLPDFRKTLKSYQWTFLCIFCLYTLQFYLFELDNLMTSHISELSTILVGSGIPTMYTTHQTDVPLLF